MRNNLVILKDKLSFLENIYLELDLMLGKWENSMEKLPRLSFYFQCIHRSQMKGNQADSVIIL